MLQFVRHFCGKSGGAFWAMAHCLVRSVLQLRLVYQVQFQHITQADWDWLETINRAAVRTIAGLAHLTPTPQLQAEAHLNTLDELIHQHCSACLRKRWIVPEAAALTTYVGELPDGMPAFSATWVPWLYRQVMDSKPLARLRVQTSGLHQPPVVVLHVPDWAPAS